MTRSIGRRAGGGRRAGVVSGLVALATTCASWAAAAPASAAAPNACKVVKKAEIQQVFGGTVSSGKKGLNTPLSAQCEFQVSANGDRPVGTVTVNVMTSGAKAAYKGLKKTSQYVPINGVPNSLYADKVHVVDILKGDVLVGVQGGFLVTDPLPIHFYDDRSQLTDLAQRAATRV